MARQQLDEELPAVKVMREWGSNLAFATAINRTASTTDRYLRNGYFVASDTAALIRDIHDAAARDGKILRHEDFVDLRLFEAVR